MVTDVLLPWLLMYCYHGYWCTVTMVTDVLLPWLLMYCYHGYSCTVTMVTHVLLPWLLMYCYHGYSCTVTMVTHVLLPWLLMYCYHGYSCTVTMVTHVLLPWLLMYCNCCVNEFLTLIFCSGGWSGWDTLVRLPDECSYWSICRCSTRVSPYFHIDFKMKIKSVFRELLAEFPHLTGKVCRKVVVKYSINPKPGWPLKTGCNVGDRLIDRLCVDAWIANQWI